MVQAVVQLVGPWRTQRYAALSKSKEVLRGLDFPTLTCVCATRAVPLQLIVSVSAMNEVSWG